MVFGSHVKTCAMYSIPPWPSLAASTAAYRRRSFSDNHPKKRCIFSSISAEYTSMLDSLSQNLSCRKDTTAQACREVILDHILNALAHALAGRHPQKSPACLWLVPHPVELCDPRRHASGQTRHRGLGGNRASL